MRIVSLLPSATEIICEIGLGANLVGVTHECDWPEFVRTLPKVTRTLIPTDASSAEIDSLVREKLKRLRALYTLDMEVLAPLRPDLIVTQTLCDVCAVAEEEVAAAACDLPGRPRVVNLEPTRLHHVFNCMQLVGDAANAPDAARDAVARLRARVEAVAHATASVGHRPRVVLLEWIDPPFSCGHWSPELVHMAGGCEMLGRAGERSRTLEWREVVRADPEVLFIACCGFDMERTMQDIPILETRPGFHQLPCVRTDRVFVTDGNAYFSRPGPRLVDSLELLAHALHPEVVPLAQTSARRLSRLRSRSDASTRRASV